MTDSRDFITSASESDAVTPTVREMRGLHAGAIIFLGIGAANIGNYAFHLIAARVLGPSSYGDVASLVAVAGLISLPLGGIQVIMARRVARASAAGRVGEIASFARRATVIALVGGFALALLLIAASPLIADGLDIESRTAVITTAALAAPAVLAPALWGLAQGLQRFGALAVAIGAAPLLRIFAVAAFLALGYGVAGAMAATLLAAVLGIAAPAWALRRWLYRTSAPSVSEGDRRSIVREFGPVAIGLLAITSLTTVDVIVAKATFVGGDAGIYASASIVGRVILYLPAAVVTVLLPKVSSRVAAGEDARSILALSMAVTILFCTLATVVYSVAPSLVAVAAFGRDFETVANLLPRFALAMTLFAVLNVQLAYHLGRGSSSMSYLLAGGAVVQIAGLALLHDSASQLIWVGIVVGAGLLVLHELLIERSVVPAAQVLSRVIRRGARGTPTGG